MNVQLVEGDNTKLELIATDAATEELMSLEGCDVWLYYRIDRGPVLQRIMRVTDAAKGRAEYVFTANDLSRGTMRGRFVIEGGGSAGVGDLRGRFTSASFELPVSNRASNGP